MVSLDGESRCVPRVSFEFESMIHSNRHPSAPKDKMESSLSIKPRIGSEWPQPTETCFPDTELNKRSERSDDAIAIKVFGKSKKSSAFNDSLCLSV